MSGSIRIDLQQFSSLAAAWAAYETNAREKWKEYFPNEPVQAEFICNIRRAFYSGASIMEALSYKAGAVLVAEGPEAAARFMGEIKQELHQFSLDASAELIDDNGVPL